MKVKVLSRNPEAFTRERKSDLPKVFRNPDPKLHPFERPREYTRALNAVKLDKIFAKPFIAALDGHLDGIWSITTLRNSLIHFASAAADGEIRLWHLGSRKMEWSAKGHAGIVRGLASSTEGDHLFSCGLDKTVKVWSISSRTLGDYEVEEENEDGEDDEEKKGSSKTNQNLVQPLQAWLAKHPLSAIDHHETDEIFATSGASIDIWNENRSEPIHSFAWGAESINTLKFSRVEHNLVASSGTDCTVILYDIRAKTPIRKVILTMQTNAISWNPMEAWMFSTASEDRNCYTFDMRKMDHAQRIHQDHNGAVMSLDYSPTGREFVTGSYDRTIRIYSTGQGHSREVYHTSRMQKIFSVKYSPDSKYIFSGSDDMILRIWKTHASETKKILVPREIRKKNYEEKLKERFAHHPDVRRIARHRHLPKLLIKQNKTKHVMKVSRKRKERNVREHSKPGSVPFVSAKKKAVLREIQ